MKLYSSSFDDTLPIAPTFCLCDIDSTESGQPVTFSANLNPALSWTDAPPQAQSFVLICYDETVPTSADDVNQFGREVPEDLPRADFFHWLLVDIPADRDQIAEGAFSKGVQEKGKSTKVPFGKTGLNDYTGWFAGDEAMAGEYFGYDGPCPPWNDSLIHTYHFKLYALDIAQCDLEKSFTGTQVRDAIAGHVLQETSLSCTYTLNPRLRE